MSEDIDNLVEGARERANPAASIYNSLRAAELRRDCLRLCDALEESFSERRGMCKEDLMSVRECADYLAFSPYTVREKARLGEIPGRKIGGQWRFSHRQILEFIESAASEAREEIKCPECHGDGVVYIEEQYIAVFCSHCKGKGYIEGEVVGETISYSGGDIPYVDKVVGITPDTPKPDREVVGEMRVVRARMEWLDKENKRLREENEIWQRIWEAMEEKLEQALVGEEPLAFWGGYRAALLDMRDAAAREREESE